MPEPISSPGALSEYQHLGIRSTSAYAETGRQDHAGPRGTRQDEAEPGKTSKTGVGKMPFHPVHYYYSTGDWLWSIFSTLLFVALIVAAVIIVARSISLARHVGPGASDRSLGGPASWSGPVEGGGRAAGWSGDPRASAAAAEPMAGNAPGATTTTTGTTSGTTTTAGTVTGAAPGGIGAYGNGPIGADSTGTAAATADPAGTDFGTYAGAASGTVAGERILAERYARSEISEEEFRSRMEVLREAALAWPAPDRSAAPPQPADPPHSSSTAQPEPPSATPPPQG